MPKHTGLLKRNGRYYMNRRVPKDLHAVYGTKVIRKSLKTSDHREAISQLHYEAFALDAEFTAKRREMKSSLPLPKVSALSDREAHEMVSRWLVEREKLSEQWYFEIISKMDEQEVEEVMDNLRTDEVVFSGGSKHYEAANARGDVDAFLKSSGLECPTDSPAYRKLVYLFTKARLENVRRNMARLVGRPVTAVEPLFREVFAHTGVISPTKPVSMGELVQRFLKALRDGKRSEGTLRTYEVPCRLLKEVFGERTPVSSLTKEQIARLFDLLRKAPSNATKRYRRLTLEQAVAMADKRGDPHRLGAKTLENYYNNIVAIFNFAVEQEMIAKNPAKDKWLRASFEQSKSPKRKAQFSADEMNKLFRAALFRPTANRADVHHKSKRKLLREGKAWVVILSLFHGLRSNEACQLYTEDIKKAEGVPFIEIRETREDGSPSEKRLKTKQSQRRVPLHPEVLKMGFLSFVEERRKDPTHPRLFPDLQLGQRGYFSDAYGKWFGRFVKITVGEDCKATFHSFRHQFRDALTEAGVPIPDVERLGGWELMSHSSERDYGLGPSLKRLRQQMQKVKFAGLDLRHLRPA